MAHMKTATNHPSHMKMLDELATVRTQYLEKRDLKILLSLSFIERTLLGPFIQPISEDERTALIEIGLVEVPEVAR